MGYLILDLSPKESVRNTSIYWSEGAWPVRRQGHFAPYLLDNIIIMDIMAFMVHTVAECDAMDNTQLLLLSLSPLSFVAFVILPAIFGGLF